MLPVRSTTAAASVSLFSADAATVSTARTSSAVRICARPPALSDGVFCENSGAVVRTIALARRKRHTRGLYPFFLLRLPIPIAESPCVAIRFRRRDTRSGSRRAGDDGGRIRDYRVGAPTARESVYAAVRRRS